jgi:uncharacterized membrane protein
MPARPVDHPAPRSTIVHTTRAAVLALLTALMLLGLVWELWLAPTGSRALALKVLPLVLPLGGVLALRLASYRALSLLVWLYVAEGAMRVMSDRGVSVQLAALELALCAGLFTACVLHIRARTRSAAAPSSTPTAGANAS